MAQHQFHLLKTTRFLPLFITQFLGAFNDNIFKNALVILITFKLADVLHYNAQILITLVAGIFILPFFLFSATAGQVADKFEKARLISIIKIAEIILMLLGAIGFYLYSIPVLMFVLFLLGAQAAFFGPVKYAILPVLLHPDELIAGNGFIEAATFLAILLGTITGGSIVLLAGYEYVLSIFLVFIAITGFVASLFIPSTHQTNPELSIRYNFVSETVRVIQYARLRRDIYLSILGISWFWLVGAVFLAEFPVYVKDILHANETVVMWFIAIFSIGIGVGSLLCNSLLKGKIKATYVPAGAIGMSIFSLDLYFSSRHSLLTDQLITFNEFIQSFNGIHISFDLLMIAICGGIYTVPLYAILQHRSEPSHRARVIASNNIFNALFMVLAALGTLFMLKLNFTVNDIFLSIGMLNAFVAVYIFKLLRK